MQSGVSILFKAVSFVGNNVRRVGQKPNKIYLFLISLDQILIDDWWWWIYHHFTPSSTTTNQGQGSPLFKFHWNWYMEASQKCFLALSLQQREGRSVRGGGFLGPNTLRGVLMCQLIFSDSCRGRLSKRKNPTICLPLFVHISYSILAHAYQIQITFFKPAK